MKQIIIPTSNNSQHNNSFLSSSLPESRFFLYQRYFSKNKNRIKLVGRSITYSYDKIRKDYFISVGYGLKNFFIFNTNIIQTLRKNTSNFPLKTTSLLQQRSKNLSIFEKHINFKSHQEFRYRNLSIKLKPFKNQLWLQKTSLLSKPLNKVIFFSLFKCIQNLSLNSTIFVLYRSWRTNLVRIYHLGFRFLLKNTPIKKTIAKYMEFAQKKFKYIGKLTYKNMLVRKKRISYNRLQKSFYESSKARLGIRKFRSLVLKRTRVIKIASPLKKQKQMLKQALCYYNYKKNKSNYYIYKKNRKLYRKIKKKKGLNKNNLLKFHKKALKKRMLHKWLRIYKKKNKRILLKNKVTIKLRYRRSERKLTTTIKNKQRDQQQLYNKYKRKVINKNSKKKVKRRTKKAIPTLKKGLKKVISFALSILKVRNFARNL